MYDARMVRLICEPRRRRLGYGSPAGAFADGAPDTACSCGEPDTELFPRRAGQAGHGSAVSVIPLEFHATRPVYGSFSQRAVFGVSHIGACTARNRSEPDRRVVRSEPDTLGSSSTCVLATAHSRGAHDTAHLRSVLYTVRTAAFLVSTVARGQFDSDAAANRHISASDPTRFTCARRSVGAVGGFI